MWSDFDTLRSTVFARVERAVVLYVYDFARRWQLAF